MSATVTTAPSTQTRTTPTLHTVQTISGDPLQVQGDEERDFYVRRAQKYLSENTFSAESDYADLDRLIFCELLVHRASVWLARGRNNYNEILTASEESDCRRVIKENGPLISSLKTDLGLTKAQRDKEQYESVGKYLVDLKARAREHGIKREKELTKAITLVKELFALVGAFDRSDEAERRELGLETENDILEWVRTRMKPEFDRIDDYFRTHHQKFWVKNI